MGEFDNEAFLHCADPCQVLRANGHTLFQYIHSFEGADSSYGPIFLRLAYQNPDQ